MQENKEQSLEIFSKLDVSSTLSLSPGIDMSSYVDWGSYNSDDYSARGFSVRVSECAGVSWHSKNIRTSLHLHVM